MKLIGHRNSRRWWQRAREECAPVHREGDPAPRRGPRQSVGEPADFQCQAWVRSNVPGCNCAQEGTGFRCRGVLPVLGGGISRRNEDCSTRASTPTGQVEKIVVLRECRRDRPARRLRFRQRPVPLHSLSWLTPRGGRGNQNSVAARWRRQKLRPAGRGTSVLCAREILGQRSGTGDWTLHEGLRIAPLPKEGRDGTPAVLFTPTSAKRRQCGAPAFIPTSSLFSVSSSVVPR